MDFLKKFWPLSFKEKNEVKDLVIPVVIYVVAPVVINIIFAILRNLPVVGFTFAIIQTSLGSLFDLYCTAGIAFSFLNYFKVGPFKS